MRRRPLGQRRTLKQGLWFVRAGRRGPASIAWPPPQGPTLRRRLGAPTPPASAAPSATASGGGGSWGRAGEGRGLPQGVAAGPALGGRCTSGGREGGRRGGETLPGAGRWRPMRVRLPAGPLPPACPPAPPLRNSQTLAAHFPGTHAPSVPEVSSDPRHRPHPGFSPLPFLISRERARPHPWGRTGQRPALPRPKILLKRAEGGGKEKRAWARPEKGACWRESSSTSCDVIKLAHRLRVRSGFRKVRRESADPSPPRPPSDTHGLLGVVVSWSLLALGFK